MSVVLYRRVCSLVVQIDHCRVIIRVIIVVCACVRSCVRACVRAYVRVVFRSRILQVVPSSLARGGSSTTVPVADKPFETWIFPFIPRHIRCVISTSPQLQPIKVKFPCASPQYPRNGRYSLTQQQFHGSAGKSARGSDVVKTPSDEGELYWLSILLPSCNRRRQAALPRQMTSR